MTIYLAPVAIVRDWHDGDTAHIDISHGWDKYTLSYDPITKKPVLSCRLLARDGRGIDAPEIETEEGIAAHAHVNMLCPPGTFVTAYSHKRDAYNGRWDGSLILPDGRDLAATMVADGHAKWKVFA